MLSFIFPSNGQSSSSTSDSGTDSSKDRSKPRAGLVRPPRLTASVDDESGSSSGVDTDSVPLSRDHDSPITIRVVEVSQPGHLNGGLSADRIQIRSDEPLSEASYALQLHGPGKETDNASVTTQDFQALHLEQTTCVSHREQDTLNTDICSSFEATKQTLGVTECAKNVSSMNAPDEDILHMDASKRLVTLSATQTTPNVSHVRGSAEDVPQVCGPVEDVPEVDGLTRGISSLLSSERIDENAHVPCASEENMNACSVDQDLDGSNSINNPQLEVPSSSSTERVSVVCCSGGSSVIHQNTVKSSQYHSSEGDVLDIEADFEESQPSSSQCQVSNASASRSNFLNDDVKQLACLSRDQSSSLLSSAASSFLEDELSGSANVVVGNDEVHPAHPDPDEEKAVATAEAVPLEQVEEQSSESGARGSASASASADDTDRSRRRNRPRGRRRRRGGKSAFYQATEAEAHFMFELAKTVLNRAGGNNSASVFTQTASSDTQPGPHRVLQLCAFEIGLFALGLHNRTSPNWLSRTYSSHVSWISGQAMEIGHQAIAILLERWEGNLTPSEVASIADRASRSNDRAMVRAAAELGLSCLHMATTLNPVEIQRALSQCRDEDAQLLDQACQAVESAARGGGVYPEVLFDVAKHWFYLHEKNQSNSSPSRLAKSESRSRGSIMRSTQSASSAPPVSPFVPQLPQFTISPSYSSIPPPLYTTPEQYVQQQMHQQVHQMMGHYPAYISANNSGYRSGSQSHYSYPFSRTLPGTQFSLSGAYAGLTPPPYQTTNVSTSSSQHLNRITTAQQGTQLSFYLNSAYRVGMLALEFLSRRTSDDRPNVKFSRNPSCSEDIRWLCTLSAKLGTSHLQRFCVAALNAVVSPFVLHDLALEAARHMARSNPAQLTANLRSPTISPLVQKSLTMYAQCIHYNLINISQNEYDEFVELLRHARGAFCMAPGGMTQFNELLQSIRWGHSKKKELWQMIMTGLAKA